MKNSEGGKNTDEWEGAAHPDKEGNEEKKSEGFE